MMHTLQAVLHDPATGRMDVLITRVPRGTHIVYSDGTRGEIRTWNQLAVHCALLIEPESDENRGERDAS